MFSFFFSRLICFFRRWYAQSALLPGYGVWVFKNHLEFKTETETQKIRFNLKRYIVRLFDVRLFVYFSFEIQIIVIIIIRQICFGMYRDHRACWRCRTKYGRRMSFGSKRLRSENIFQSNKSVFSQKRIASKSYQMIGCVAREKKSINKILISKWNMHIQFRSTATRSHELSIANRIFFIQPNYQKQIRNNLFRSSSESHHSRHTLDVRPPLTYSNRKTINLDVIN